MRPGRLALEALTPALTLAQRPRSPPRPQKLGQPREGPLESAELFPCAYSRRGRMLGRSPTVRRGSRELKAESESNMAKKAAKKKGKKMKRQKKGRY